jgi:glycerol-3-phosphate dehydrogenase (NAD(P)+)
LSAAIQDVDDVIIVVPSVGFRATLNMLKPLIHPHVRVICASKGLDGETGKLLSEVAEETLGKEHKFAVLSGPSFAREVAAGKPAAVVIASHHKALVSELTKRFDSPLFRIYPSNDVVGVEVGGVVKNVIAIATGIFDGMELGANARSALITHGLEEIMRLGIRLGGQKDTFVGLAGLGDLILTCSDDLSRNRRMGLALGRGKNVQEAEREIGQVVEGKRNAEIVVMLANKIGVDMPICSTVWQILNGKLSAKEAVTQLLARPAVSTLGA